MDASGRSREFAQRRTNRICELGTWDSLWDGRSERRPGFRRESDVVFPPTASKFRTLDLGELTLPPTPVPDGFLTPEFRLNVYGAFSDGGAGSNRGTHRFKWSVDCVSLLPIDEGAATVDGIGPTERILLDTSSELGDGVYALDETDTLLRSGEAEGAAFALGPESARIYIARDDESNPSSVKFEVRTLMRPLAAGV